MQGGTCPFLPGRHVPFLLKNNCSMTCFLCNLVLHLGMTTTIQRLILILAIFAASFEASYQPPRQQQVKPQIEIS